MGNITKHVMALIISIVVLPFLAQIDGVLLS